MKAIFKLMTAFCIVSLSISNAFTNHIPSIDHDVKSLEVLASGYANHLANPTDYEFCDDFESYTAGQQLVQQNSVDWTTWSNAPGGSEDPFVVSNGTNAIEIMPNNDLIHLLDNFVTGFYTISFDMYIPAGFVAYFNTLQDFAGSSSQWGMQVYFGSDNAQLTPGIAWIDGGAALAASFNFDYDTWMSIEIAIDLTNDWAEMKVNGTSIHGWVWSSGTFGTGTLNQLGGSNFYGWTPAVGTGKYYFDNYCVIEGDGPELLPPTNLTATISYSDVHLEWDAPDKNGAKAILMGYNVYRNYSNIDYVPTPITEYYDLDLNPGSYDYKITAVYDEGESGPSNIVNIICTSPPWIPPPQNLCASSASTGTFLTWDVAGSSEWIQWDAGINNGNGVGLTSGGSFSCASHWVPADLIPYDGYSLQKIQFWPNADTEASYVIKVWTGSDGTNLIHEQYVTSFIVDDWNEVFLTTPVLINSETDLWFGYTVTHAAETLPAGCDNGPAIQGKGDMISTGGAWSSMYSYTGGVLDYNWNIAGYVRPSDSKKTTLQPMVETFAPVNFNTSFQSAVQHSLANEPVATFTTPIPKDYLFNVYWKPAGGSYSKLNSEPVSGNSIHMNIRQMD